MWRAVSIGEKSRFHSSTVRKNIFLRHQQTVAVRMCNQSSGVDGGMLGTDPSVDFAIHPEVSTT